MKISIITACFNSEKYIQSAIESVLCQDYNDIEYIIIDGRSKDNTIGIIKNYESAFNGRLKWISEPDSGLYDALNKGLKLATGKIVGILNSDDYFTSNAIVTQIVNTFYNVDCDAVYGDIHFIESEDPTKCVRYYSSSVFKRSLMRIGFMPAHPTFYAYKHLFERFGYYKTDYRIAADFELLLRFIYIHKIKTKYISSDFVTMRTGGLSTESVNSRMVIMKEHLRAFKEARIFTNRFILSLRYPYKIMELLKGKL